MTCFFNRSNSESLTLALIVAAGKGERLKTVSKDPKALAIIAGHTLLEHTIIRFAKTGISTIYIIVRFQKEIFIDYIHQYSKLFSVKIEFVILEEDTYVDSPISDIVKSIVKINKPFKNLLISYCDTITNFDVNELMKFHYTKKGLSTLLLFSDSSGIFKHKYSIDDDGKINSISEAEYFNRNRYAHGGIFIIEKELIADYDGKQKIEFSINSGPIEKAFNANSLYGVTTNDCYFMEIGNPFNFNLCEKRLLESSSLINTIFNV